MNQSLKIDDSAATYNQILPQPTIHAHQISSCAIMKLRIATKAPQATTFPILLVAHFAKETAKAEIDIDFEEAEILDTRSKATVILSYGSKNSISNLEDVLRKLAVTGDHSSSQKHVSMADSHHDLLFMSRRSMNGLLDR